MGESVITSLFSFFSSMCEYVFKATKPLKKDKRDVLSCTKEDKETITILIDAKTTKKRPAKKTFCSFSESEQKARREWAETRIYAARLVQGLERKSCAEKPLSEATLNSKDESISGNSSSDDSVKAKAESSSKEPAKKLDISSEDDSEDAKESDGDGKPIKADTKSKEKESTNSDDSSDEWIMI